MRQWIKKGLIYNPPHDNSWRDNSALTPTAIEIERGIIRVYASFRDRSGIGRIGYVDLDADNPSRLLGISDKPVLDIGAPGMFDDNGVILGDLVRVEHKIYMYYVGFQLVKKAKFLAYTGVACSDGSGMVFERVSQTPVMDRHDEGKYIRAIHSILYEDGKFKTWYAVGNGWEKISGIDYPQYDINYTESSDGLCFDSGTKVLRVNKDNKEYRIGRPRVYKSDGMYVMNFTYGTTDDRYHAGQAMSDDGIHWRRDDNQLGITISKEGWDSKHLSYPSILTAKNGKTYIFYNGNDMGKNGFGYAELSEI